LNAKSQVDGYFMKDINDGIEYIGLAGSTIYHLESDFSILEDAPEGAF
jgi:hypothetical protein